MKNSLFILIISLLTIPLIYSLPNDNNNQFNFKYTTPINYSSVNVNNSQYFQSYTPTTLYNYFKGFFDSIYLTITDQRYNETGVINTMNQSWLSTYNSTYDAKADYQFTDNNFNGSGNITLWGKTYIGINVTPASPLHIKQIDSQIGSATGITSEQGGTGDAIVQYVLTGVRRWLTGIDNSDSDTFKISPANSLDEGVLNITTSGNLWIKGNMTIGSIINNIDYLCDKLGICYNLTILNQTTSGSGDNSSWNQSLADTLYTSSSGFNANNLTSGSVPTLRVTNVTCGSGQVMQNYTSSGAQCITPTSAPATRNIYRVTSPTINSTNNTVFTTLFTIPITANNNYTLDCFMQVNSNVTTTGVQFNMSLPATPTQQMTTFEHPTTLVALNFTTCNGALKDCLDLATTSILFPNSAYVKVHSLIENSNNNGNLLFQFKSETANVRAIIMRGSYCELGTI